MSFSINLQTQLQCKQETRYQIRIGVFLQSCLLLELFMLAVLVQLCYIGTILSDEYTLKQGPRSREGGGGHAPHFSPQMQFFTAFLDYKATKSCQFSELQLKFDDQIPGNCIFKVPVFKISRDQSAWTPLDGLRLLRDYGSQPWPLPF